MTEQEQQIALCKWAGWRDIRFNPQRGHVDGIEPNYPNYPNPVRHDLPDTNSLDVLATFEARLNEDQQQDYVMRLHRCYAGTITGNGATYRLAVDWLCITAAASIRREEMCKVLGLWKG